MSQKARLSDYLAKKARGIVPAETPDEMFELYSVPSFEHGQPEVVSGAQIGSNKQIVEPGTVLLSKINPRINRAWYVDSWSAHAKIASTEWLTFPPNPAIEPKFLMYWLRRNGLRDHLAANASGVGGSLMRVKGATLDGLSFPLPDLTAQRDVIAEIEKQFSRLDEASANLRRVKARLLIYRESVINALFSDEPNSTLADLIERGPQNGLYLPKSAYGSGTPILRIDDYQTDWLRPRADLRRVAASDAQVHAWALVAGDLVVNRVNSMSHLGKCASIPEALAGTLFESNMMRLHLKHGAIPRFVELYLGGKLGRKRLTANAKWAVNQASINQQDVLATPISLPAPDRQQAIVAEVDRRLSIVRGVEAEVDANLKRAQALRQAVLQRAFAGRSDSAATKTAAKQPALRLIPGTESDVETARVVLSAEIVHRLHAKPHFGRVKHQKIVHLCEYIAELELVQGHYVRAAAGPLDLPMIEANARTMKTLGWYAEHTRADGRHEYRALSKAGEHKPYLACFSDEQLQVVRKLIDLTRDWDTDRCEMFSTVYAAWNDLLLFGAEPTPEAIVGEVLGCWNDTKLRFTRKQWLRQIEWVRSHGFEPCGFGRPTRGQTDGLTPDFFRPTSS